MAWNILNCFVYGWTIGNRFNRIKKKLTACLKLLQRQIQPLWSISSKVNVILQISVQFFSIAFYSVGNLFSVWTSWDFSGPHNPTRSVVEIGSSLNQFRDPHLQAEFPNVFVWPNGCFILLIHLCWEMYKIFLACQGTSQFSNILNLVWRLFITHGAMKKVSGLQSKKWAVTKSS